MIEKRGKRGFIALVVSFLMLNLIVGLASNCYFTSELLKKDYYITVELHSNAEKARVKELEKTLLEKRYVTGVKYLSKDQAFRELQKELEVVIPKNDNQLPNSLLITFKTENDFEEIREFLEKSKLVREIYVDEFFLVNINKKINALNILFFILVGSGIAIFYTIIAILKDSISIDYMALNMKNGDKDRNYTVVKTKNYVIFFAALFLGTLIFLNGYIFLRDEIQLLMENFVLQSFKQLLLSELVVLGVVSLVALNTTRKYKVEDI